MSNDLHLDGDFTLNIPHYEANFTENQPQEIKTDFNINIAPDISSGSELIEIIKENINITITSKTFVFEQAIASSNWIINHNLDKHPSAFAVDSAGKVVIPDEIIYISENQIELQFISEFSGKAYLN